MSIIFKLVGHVNSCVLEIKHDISGIVKLSSIISIFKNYDISQESFEYIKFVIESETLKDDSKFFQISNDNLIIFVFTTNEVIREKLIKIFLENKININNLLQVDKELANTVVDILEQVDEELTKPDNNNSENVDEELTKPDNDISEQVDEELTKPVVDKIYEEQIPELSQEIINTINIKTAKLFENEDFKHLIRIYYSNPDILKTFLNFVSQGDIVKMNIPIISEEKDYSFEIEMLKSLGINESDDTIKQVLGSFNGHLNLSLRVLLIRSAIKFDT